MNALPEPTWRIVENALVVPPSGDGRPAMGIFDADGRFLPASATKLSNGLLSKEPPLPNGDFPQLPGLHFYGGLGRMHFGHFLLESAVRFWALDALETPPSSVVFTPLPKADLNTALRKSLRDLYAGLSGGLPYHSLKEPTRIELLVLASPGFGHGDWIGGTPAFRDYIAQTFADTTYETRSERLYISRSRLAETRQRVDQEESLEAFLASAGYTIFHPQAHDLGTQIERYRAASMILGGDGSAFHLLAFVLNPATRVGLIQRRNRPEVIDLLVRQMQAFAGVTPAAFDATLPLDAQRALVPKGANAPTPLDLEKLMADLTSAGFV